MKPAIIAALTLLAMVSHPGFGAASAAPADLYKARCAMCHQSNAQGLAGTYPRLAGRVGTIAQSPEGRRYLALVVLNGMYGKIEIEGGTMSGMMPTLRVMKDSEIADILTHLAKLQAPAKKLASFTAAEVAAVRAEGTIGGSKVVAERARLVAAKVIP